MRDKAADYAAWQGEWKRPIEREVDRTMTQQLRVGLALQSCHFVTLGARHVAFTYN